MIRNSTCATNWRHRFVFKSLRCSEITTTKYKVKKNDGNNNFNLPRVKKRTPLVHQGLHYKVFLGKDKLPECMPAHEKEEMEMKTHSFIQLSLAIRVYGKFKMKISLSACGSNWRAYT